MYVGENVQNINNVNVCIVIQMLLFVVCTYNVNVITHPRDLEIYNFRSGECMSLRGNLDK